jgi:hypothetical protein
MAASSIFFPSLNKLTKFFIFQPLSFRSHVARLDARLPIQGAHWDISQRLFHPAIECSPMPEGIGILAIELTRIIFHFLHPYTFIGMMALK